MNNDTLQKIYNDFSGKLLPKLGDGLSITKDYFQDLFGRYVKYLIITDSLSVVLAIIGCVAGLILLKKAIKILKDDDMNGAGVILMSISAILLIISPFGLYSATTNLVKDLTIPEVRVYETLIQNK